MGSSNKVKATILSYVSIFINIVISIVYTPWMINKIGVSDYGLYSLVGVFLSYFMLDFGLANTITRFIAKYRAEGDEEKIANILGLTAKVYFVLDVIIFVILFVLYFFLSNIFDGLTLEEVERLKVLYCIAGIFSILSFLFKPVSGVMMAYEYFVENKLLDLVVRVGTVVFVVVMLLLNGNVFHLVFITGFVGFLAALIRYIVLLRKSKLKINWRYFEKGELFVLLSFSGWVLFVQIAQLFRINLVPTILGIYSNTTEISLFSVGKNLEGMVYTIAAALNGLFLPTVSRMVQSKDRNGIMELMIKVGRIQLFIIFLIFSGFCVFGESFINLWVGDLFHASYYVFILLVFVNLLSLTMQIGMDLVYAENKIRHTATRIFISSSIGLVLSFIVAPKYGAVGCAAATGFSLVLTQFLYVQFYNNKLGLNMTLFFRRCHLKILPLLTVYAAIYYFLWNQIAMEGWLVLVMSIAIYTLGYIAIVYFMLFNDDEKKFILGFVKKKSN